MKFLYQLQFPDGKLYIGASKNPKRRLNAHMVRSRTSRSEPVYQAIRQHGKPQLKILVCGTDDYIEDLEVKAIELYQTRDPGRGHNVLVGGKLSRLGLPGSMLGKTISEEGKRRISENSKGNTHSKGKRMPEEAKIAISKALTGRKLSEETKKRMGEAWKLRRNKNA